MEDTDYALGRTDAEYDRLIEQANLLRPLTERMLRAAGVFAGMHMLDIGCGVGDVSFLISEFVGPTGSVVGVDIDGEALKLADQRRASRGITNVAFLHGDARSFDAGRLFDGAVGRLVLMYTSDPTEALRLIGQRVRPGGLVAFHEWSARVDAAAASVGLPVLASLQALMSKAFERSGARLEIGPELYWRMLDAGLEPQGSPIAEIAVHVGQDDVGYRRWASMTQSMLPKIVKYGLATEPEVLYALEQLRDELLAARCPVPLSWLMIGQWARKPTS